VLAIVHPAYAQRPAATIELMMGQVSLQEGGHPGKPLFAGNHVMALETIVTGPDSYAKFHLDDNSTFEVFEKSTVQFRSDYPAWAHLLNVIMGRVKVFIDHSKGPNSNSVTTPTAVISVRGTVFDVVVEDADGTTLVSCDDGLVQVRNSTAPGAEPLLHPGEWTRVFRGQGLMGQQVSKNPVMQQALKVARDTVQVLLQRRIGSPGIGGIGGPVAGTAGAQGDKGKGGAAPPPAPPPASGGK
jgi:hypothetical protein